MEFTPIETQEQFDAMVKDRVERAKSAGAKDARKEFETQLKDLEQLKESVTAKDTEIGTLKAKITDLEAEKKTSGESFNSMQKELSQEKLSALKQRIAIDAGIPLEMADRLNGEDEESIKELNVAEDEGIYDNSIDEQLEKINSVQVGTIVTHKKFGKGKISWIDKKRTHIKVNFEVGEKQFLFPDSIMQEHLIII